MAESNFINYKKLVFTKMFYSIIKFVFNISFF